ncbi:MAG TPA: MarR family transcriptional regulator [Gemmatimonadales bacterium]|jgi:DNA-binding MarR family transcriptional regulator
MAVGAGAPEQVADRLHSAAVTLLRRLRREDAGLAIGPARTSTLAVLVFAGPKTMGELAAIEQVRPPTMSRIVAALEADLLALRESDPDDRRAQRVRATTLGRRVAYRDRERRVGVLTERLRAHSAEEIALLDRAAELIERLAR